MRPRYWIALAASSAALIWWSQPRLRKGEKILLIGDSLGVGLGPRLKKLANDAGHLLVWTATQGTRIDQWAGQWTTQGVSLGVNLTLKPDVVLVSLGTNDSYMSDAKAIAAVSTHLEKLISTIELSGARVYWIGPPRLPKADNGAIAQIRRRLPWHRYFDSSRLTIPRQSDQLHPDTDGYDLWAAAIWRWLA